MGCGCGGNKNVGRRPRRSFSQLGQKQVRNRQQTTTSLRAQAVQVQSQQQKHQIMSGDRAKINKIRQQAIQNKLGRL